MSDFPTFPPAVGRRVPWVISIAVGVASGGLGAWLLLWFVPEVRTARIPPGTQSVIVERPGQVVVEESTRIRELRAQNQRLVGRLVRAGTGGTAGAATLYPPTATLGEAVVLTSDGWFATTANTGVSVGDRILIEHLAYPIAQLLKDPVSPLLLGKVTGSTFTPTLFTDPSVRYPGMTVFGLTSEGATAKTTLLSEDAAVGSANTFVGESDALSFALQLPTAVSTLAFGTPVFGLDGSLVGIVFAHGERELALPSEVVATFLENALASGKPARSSLGVAYVFDAGNGAEVQPAAIIYNSDGQPGVTPKSPAARAGLAVGDRILAVNGEAVGKASSLFALLERYPPGTAVTMTIDRRGRSVDLPVTLGSVKP